MSTPAQATEAGRSQGCRRPQRPWYRSRGGHRRHIRATGESQTEGPKVPCSCRARSRYEERRYRCITQRSARARSKLGTLAAECTRPTHSPAICSSQRWWKETQPRKCPSAWLAQPSRWNESCRLPDGTGQKPPPGPPRVRTPMNRIRSHSTTRSTTLTRRPPHLAARSRRTDRGTAHTSPDHGSPPGPGVG